MPQRVKTRPGAQQRLTRQALSLLLGLAFSFSVSAGELGDMLHATLEHPQIRASARLSDAAQAQVDAASGRYLGSATVSSGWHRYEDKRVVGIYTPGTSMVPLVSDSMAQTGVNYSLPVDLFGVIAANKTRAQHDLRTADLLGRQQMLLKLHQAANAYISLQSLLKQQESLALSRKRVDATARRVRKEFELGRAAGVDARYANSEVARLQADEAVLNGAVAQAQADFTEAAGPTSFLPRSTEIRVPPWDGAQETPLPVQIAQARQQSVQAQAEENRRALLPSFTLDANYFHSNVLGGDHRDTWAVGGVLSLPLGVSQYRQAGAQRLAAEAAADQSEAVSREAGRQLVSLRAAYDAALADAAAMETEVSYREEVAHVEQNMQRLGNQTLENLFRHERDLLDARYRLAQARGRAAATWSAAQVVIGSSAETYITRMDAK